MAARCAAFRRRSSAARRTAPARRPCPEPRPVVVGDACRSWVRSKPNLNPNLRRYRGGAPDGEHQARLPRSLSRHRPATLHALQLARQVPCLFSVEGTSVSIYRAVALRQYPAFPPSSPTATIWPISADLVNIRQTPPLLFRRALP